VGSPITTTVTTANIHVNFSRFLFFYNLDSGGCGLAAVGKAATTCSEIALNKSVAQSQKSVAL
jgi:hypothetical protein